jgi:CubicO group peptidase (beta-lactamase class C family)
MENHASLYMGLGDDNLDQLGTEVSSKLGVNLSYAEPVLAGGVKITSTEYAKFLQRILSGALQMHDLLGTNSVCTGNAGCAKSGYSPTDDTGLNWHYSMGHWVESDGTFSSAGAFGYYPWIDKSVRFYGVLARHVNLPMEKEGLNSAMCGAAIRQAWMAAQGQ